MGFECWLMSNMRMNNCKNGEDYECKDKTTTVDSMPHKDEYHLKTQSVDNLNYLIVFLKTTCKFG